MQAHLTVILELCVCPDVLYQSCSELFLLAPHLAGPVEVAAQLSSSLARHHVKEVPHKHLVRGHVSRQGGGETGGRGEERSGEGGGEGREGRREKGGKISIGCNKEAR